MGIKKLIKREAGESVKPWESKTIIIGVLSALIPFIPGGAVWVAANPEAYAAILGLVFSGLRCVSDGKIKFK